MKNTFRIVSFLLIVLVGMVSCKKTTRSFMPPVTGKAGEVLVIMNESLWKGSSGDSIKAILSEEQVGLPQPEPVLDIVNIPHSAFSRMFKTYRSILDVKISKKVSKAGVKIKRGSWAKDQAYMRLEASNEQELIKLIGENRDKILTFFISSEKDRLINVLTKKPEKKIFNSLKKKYHFTLAFPSGYNINKDYNDFMWISKETPQTSQGLFVYSFDYKSQNNFSQEFLQQKRDSLLKAYIPGPSDGSYMTTESRFPVRFQQFSFKENYGVEMRGLWKVKNDFMGGPFLNISFLDQKNNRVICLDGYVYYPNQEKRELLRELEAIIYTFQYNKKSN